MLRAIKNRFGGTDEFGVFAMGARGLTEVPNPSMLFLTSRDQLVPGSVVFPALQDTTPFLVATQALVFRGPSGATPPRTVCVGASNRRCVILLPPVAPHQL